MRELCFLLDENVPHAIRDQLLLRDPAIDVICIGDGAAPPFGTPDPQILKWLASNTRVLVSRNRRTMPLHLRAHVVAGGHIPGILLLRPRRGLGEVIDDLLLIWESCSREELRDSVVYLPI